jgi:hypothetical protein
LGLNIDFALLWNRYGWGGIDNAYLQPNIHYRLLTSVNEKIQLGGVLNYSPMLYRNEYWDSHHNYWRTKINLGLSSCFQMPINSDWNIFVPVNLPLFGFISRPESERYLVLNESDLEFWDVIKRMHSDFQFVAIGYKFFEIEPGIFFEYMLPSGRTTTYGYKLFFEQTTVSLQSQLLTHQITAQYSF